MSETAPERSGSPASSTGSPEWRTAAFLAVAIILCLVFVSRVSGLDLAAWQTVHADSNAVWEPGGVYGDAWNSARFDPFANGHLAVQDLVLLVLHIGSVVVIGTRLLWTVATTRTWPVGVQMGAGFLIGYLPLVTVTRLVSLWLPLTYAALTVLVLEVATAIAVLASSGRLPLSRLEGGEARDRTSILAVGSLVAVTIVWTYQSGRNFLVSDSLVEFLELAAGEHGDFRFLPLFGKQSDEYLFSLMPLTLGTPASTALWFWLMNAFAKASFACLCFGTVRNLGPTRLVAPLAVGLVFFVTPAADPRWYLSLMGGQNPVVYLGHAGRFLGILLPMVVLALLARDPDVPPGLRGLLPLLVFGVGLMSTSVHNLVAVSMVVGLATLVTVLDRLPPDVLAFTRSPGVHRRLAMLAIAAPLFGYASLHDTSHEGYRGIPILLGCLAALLLLTGLATSRQGGPPPPPVDALGNLSTRRILALAAGVGIGGLTMGNLFYGVATGTGTVASVLRRVAPAFGEDPVQVRSFDTELTPFTASDCVDAPTAACRSFEGFIGYFGTTFLLVALLWWALERSSAESRLRRRDGILLMSAHLLLLSGLFLTDFLGTTDTVTYWSQTRFFEIGYYSIWLLAPVVVSTHLRGATRRVGFGLLVTWVVVPVLAHPFLAQWLRNAAHLARAAL